MHRHPHRGERRAELVGHGRHQIVLQLVEPQQPCHVLQHDGGAGHVALLGVERRGTGKEGATSPFAFHPDGLLHASRGVAALPRKDVGADLVDGLPELRRESGERIPPGFQAEQALRGLVDVEHLPIQREHDHRIGHAVDGRLRGLLRLEQLPERAAPVLAELVGHGVQLAADLRDLVLALDTRPRLQVTLADAAYRQAEQLQRTQRPAGERNRRQEAQPERRGDRQQQQRAIALGGAPRPLALQQHRILVDLEDPLGGVLDAEKRGFQLVEVPPALLQFVTNPAVGLVLRQVLVPRGAKPLRRLRFARLGDVALLRLELRFEGPDVGGRLLIGLVRPPGGAECRRAVHALHGVLHPLRREHTAEVVAQDELRALAQRVQGVERHQPHQRQARGQRRLRQQQAGPERHWRSSPVDATTCRSKSPPSRSRRVRTEPSNTCFHQGCSERPTIT